MSNRPIAIEAARSAMLNVGVTEVGGDNRGQWVETYQRSVGIPPGSPWCAAFVRYRFEVAAERLDRDLPPGFPDSGWVPSYVGWAKSTGIWLPRKSAQDDHTQVRPGDLACYWYDASQRCAHIGIIVEPATADGFVTVEGNTGPDRGTAVERDGDGVYRKRRRWSALGSGGGIIRINW